MTGGSTLMRLRTVSMMLAPRQRIFDHDHRRLAVVAAGLAMFSFDIVHVGDIGQQQVAPSR